MDALIFGIWTLSVYFIGICVGRWTDKKEKKHQVSPDIKVGEVYTMIEDRYVTVKVVEILGDTVYYNFW